MVFAVPITLMVLILVQASDELAWVNVLLGADRIFGGRRKNLIGMIQKSPGSVSGGSCTSGNPASHPKGISLLPLKYRVR